MTTSASLVKTQRRRSLNCCASPLNFNIQPNGFPVNLLLKFWPIAYVFYFLLNKIAAITPGIHPTQVKSKVINIAPQPLSRTAKGGKIIHKIALPIPIFYTLLFFLFLYFTTDFLKVQQMILFWKIWLTSEAHPPYASLPRANQVSRTPPSDIL